MKKFIVRGIICALYLLLFFLVGAFCYSYTYSLKKVVLSFGLMVCTVVVCFFVVRLYEFKVKKKVPDFYVLKRILIFTYSFVLILSIIYSICVFKSYSVRTPGGFSLKTNFFTNKDVMVIIPHQDDDILMIGGMLSQYTRNGSEVSVVFATHGDAANIAETRINEAKKVLENLGVKKENIYFLGFGNRWQEKRFDSQGVKHIYNSPDGNAVWTSVNNRTKTYNVKGQNSYIECDYTRNNYLNSIKAVIKDKRPDIIYAVDYDNHIDHKAVSLLFDEALGQILREDGAYMPAVYKGFAYGTSWTAEDDFLDSYNLLSTKMPEEEVWKNSASGFAWDDRVRIPIDAENTNRMIRNTPIYKALAGYASQFASAKAGRVLQGDRVFWERRTDSILYSAEILADGKAEVKLNDFKIKDSNDISVKAPPTDGVVSADKIDVLMNKEECINTVILYDNADLNSNIMGGYIVFDDESRVDFGELKKDGSTTEIVFPERKVHAFSVYITETEGDVAGLTEIEAYNDRSATVNAPEYIMAVDDNENFVYNYWIENGETAEFKLYGYTNDLPVSTENIKVESNGDPECICAVKGESIVVNCPEGKKIKIRLVYNDAVSTEFCVENPGIWTRISTSMMKSFNKSSIIFDRFKM